MQVKSMYKSDFLQHFGITKNCNVCIFGAGDYGKKILTALNICGVGVECFLDNNSDKWGTVVDKGIECHSLREVSTDSEVLVIVALAQNADNAARQLSKSGFAHVITYEDAMGFLSEKIDALINDFGIDLVKYMADSGVGTDSCLKKGCFPMPVHFYQPIPDICELEKKDIWSKVSNLSGIKFEPDKYMETLREVAKYKPPVPWSRTNTENNMDFSLDNNSFSYMCASALYGIISKHKPKRIIEVGSGNSSKVIRQAIQYNTIQYTIIDPYCQFNETEFDGIDCNILKSKVEDVDLSVFEQLEENDILFIDSSHTVRIGGDVNYEILEVLPVLKKGVLIHFHDISLPYEYDKIYYTNPQFRVFWTESYLLQAFLAFNSQYEVYLPLLYLERNCLPELQRLYPDMKKPFDWSSGSFWIRRKL
jgi:hypothetical protein